jgi:hypothetical protein
VREVLEDMFVPDFVESLIGCLATVGLKISSGGFYGSEQHNRPPRNMQGRLKREF